MRSHTRILAPISGALLLVLLAAVWVGFAPAKLGGSVSYVMVSGNSMQPKFARGDLVVVREADAYEIGDVVAYSHPDIGPVIHRIVGREGDSFVFRGDGNTWLDSYKPRESEFIGKSWIHLPSAGKLVERLRGPGGMAVLSGIMGVIAMTMFVTTKDQGKDLPRGRAPAGGRSQGGRPAARKGAGPSGGGGAEGVTTALVAVLLASLLLAFFAFGRPASVTVPDGVGYEHKGEFGYSADVPAGLYDKNEVQTGEPVFRKVTDTVDVRFDYRLTSDQATDGVEGTYRLVAEVSDVNNGWKRTILLQPDTRFTGGGFTAMSVLDLSEVQDLTTTLERRTGIHTDRYAVSIVPQVSVGGTLAGKELEEEFSPSLDFWLDSLQLQLQSPATGGTDPLVEPDGADPLKPSEEGSTSRSATEPNKLSILGFDLGVPMARKLSVLGAVLSLGGLLWFVIPILRALRGDEATRIRTQYAPLLVSVSGDPASGKRVVEVAAVEDLAKIAERGGQSILHRTSGDADDYYVQDSGTTYHYRAAAPGSGDTPSLIQRLGA